MFEKFLKDFAAWFFQWLRSNGVSVPQVSDSMLPDNDPSTQCRAEDRQLFRFIHPAVVDDGERLKVHCEVCNLAKNFPMVTICKHLSQMKRDNRVYLGVKPELMFEELHRIGMPDDETEGFSYKNFMHHFNIK